VTTALIVAVSIDVECDKDERWVVRRPLTFRGVEEGIGERLVSLFDEYHVRPTYLLSPEVIRNDGCAEMFKGLQGCELGTHLHPEFVYPGPPAAETTGVPCLMPEAEEQQALKALTAAFVEAFDRPPVSYRAGRYGANARSLRTLAGLGYLVDSSVTPGKLWDYGLDFRGAPTYPYYPDVDSITKTRPSGPLLEVPVSLRPSPVPPGIGTAVQVIRRTHLDVAKDVAKWARGPAWFRPGWSSKRALLSFVRAAAQGENRGVLNMMFHNIDMVPGCSPNAASRESVRTALDDLRGVLEEVLARGGCFMTLAEIQRHVTHEWTRF
jgi:hypothetical protein